MIDIPNLRKQNITHETRNNLKTYKSKELLK